MADPKAARPGWADLVVTIGLVCLTVGVWTFVGAGSLIAPGAILLWYALPPRPPFVVRDR